MFGPTEKMWRLFGCLIILFSALSYSENRKPDPTANTYYARLGLTPEMLSAEYSESEIRELLRVAYKEARFETKSRVEKRAVKLAYRELKVPLTRYDYQIKYDGAKHFFDNLDKDIQQSIVSGDFSTVIRVAHSYYRVQHAVEHITAQKAAQLIFPWIELDRIEPRKVDLVETNSEMVGYLIAMDRSGEIESKVVKIIEKSSNPGVRVRALRALLYWDLHPDREFREPTLRVLAKLSQSEDKSDREFVGTYYPWLIMRQPKILDHLSVQEGDELVSLLAAKVFERYLKPTSDLRPANSIAAVRAENRATKPQKKPAQFEYANRDSGFELRFFLDLDPSLPYRMAYFIERSHDIPKIKKSVNALFILPELDDYVVSRLVNLFDSPSSEIQSYLGNVFPGAVLRYSNVREQVLKKFSALSQSKDHLPIGLRTTLRKVAERDQDFKQSLVEEIVGWKSPKISVREIAALLPQTHLESGDYLNFKKYLLSKLKEQNYMGALARVLLEDFDPQDSELLEYLVRLVSHGMGPERRQAVKILDEWSAKSEEIMATLRDLKDPFFRNGLLELSLKGSFTGLACEVILRNGNHLAPDLESRLIAALRKPDMFNVGLSVGESHLRLLGAYSFDPGVQKNFARAARVILQRSRDYVHFTRQNKRFEEGWREIAISMGVLYPEALEEFARVLTHPDTRLTEGFRKGAYEALLKAEELPKSVRSILLGATRSAIINHRDSAIRLLRSRSERTPQIIARLSELDNSGSSPESTKTQGAETHVRDCRDIEAELGKTPPPPESKPNP